MAIFKGTYRGQGIYWEHGAYNLDGTGYYPKIQEARDAIDMMMDRRKAQDAIDQANAIANAAVTGVRDGDTVTLQTPDGAIVLTIRQYRQQIFDLEAKYGPIAIAA